MKKGPTAADNSRAIKDLLRLQAANTSSIAELTSAVLTLHQTFKTLPFLVNDRLERLLTQLAAGHKANTEAITDMSRITLELHATAQNALLSADKLNPKPLLGQLQAIAAQYASGAKENRLAIGRLDRILLKLDAAVGPIAAVAAEVVNRHPAPPAPAAPRPARPASEPVAARAPAGRPAKKPRGPGRRPA